MRLWPCYCLLISAARIASGPTCLTVLPPGGLSGWRSWRGWLAHRRAPRVTTMHSKSSPRLAVVRTIVVGCAFSGMRGTCGVRSGERRGFGGFLLGAKRGTEVRGTVAAVAEEQLACAGVICGDMAFWGDVQRPRVCLRPPNDVSSLRERA